MDAHQKATEALDINLVSTKPSDKRVVGYTIACINAFAKQFNIPVKAAVNYLNRFKGIDFLINHYDAQHLLSIDDTVQDLVFVCENNGGELYYGSNYRDCTIELSRCSKLRNYKKRL